MKISVVIPAYNEAGNIPVIINKVTNTLNNLVDVAEYEVIICDDHSNDGTFQEVEGQNNNNIKCIRLSRRSGSHVAIRAGLSISKGDVVLCISADGQDDPVVLNKMIEKIKEGYHIVWGVRNKREEPFLNKVFAELFYKLLSFFVQNESNIDLANADFYLLGRKVVDSINECKERNTSLFGLIAWMGFRQSEVKYERKERSIGKSKWTLNSKLKLAADWILAFSGLPLKFISLLGIVVATFGFIYSIVIIVLSLYGYTTSGWAETAILILVLGGVQLIMIGVVGEYLWRTLDESRNRPLFFIEKEINNF
jgi:glycosyltransferase involved in cell wall biosynthesis